MRRLQLLVLLSLVAQVPGVYAHELRPAYLELRQTGADTYDVFWKVPGRGDTMRLGLYVELPEGCANRSKPHGVFAAGSFTERWSVACAGGLAGGMLHITGLAATVTDVLVRLARLDGTAQVTRLTPSPPSFVIESAPHPLEVARTYLVLGVEHILTGVDHLLFVSGLVLLVSGFGRLATTISAFTVSHSVTLSLATLGFVHVPPAPVEAVIALSILFVACEIVRGPMTPPSLTQRQPWLMAFTFGLLHGLGFAGGLSEVGLPVDHIPLALALFSVGVEIGHFSFVGVMVALIAAFRHWRVRPPSWARALSPYAIGAVAAFWVMQRLAAF